MVIPENVPAAKAQGIVDKPREAEVVQPFKKGTFSPELASQNSQQTHTASGQAASGSQPTPSGSKRRRLDSGSETGNPSNIKYSTQYRVKNVQDGSISNRKYGPVMSKEAKNVVKSLPAVVDHRYISAAYAKNTWKRLNAAKNCLRKFAENTNTHIAWPLDSNTALHFTNWALTNQKLSHSTVRAYLHDISLLHKLKNVDNSSCSSFLIQTTLKGARNLEMYEAPEKGKSTITISLLKKIGSEIYKCNMSKTDKQVYWTCCVVAFWGSFRIGELLSKSEVNTDIETLKWNDIILDDKHAAIMIKRPKANKGQPDIVDLFEVKGLKCCPIKALNKMRELALKNGKDSPFKFEDGTNLTQRLFTEKIKEWALPHTSKEFVEKLTGHCFRSAIQTILAARPDIASDDDIKIWGRWSSESYKIYAKKSVETKRIIFEKIKTAIFLSYRR